ncbi:MAG: hypothetical protein V2I35_02420, partial [Desulfocapsaceae bacterium]|nr:hypothetical protein [Desulfocapsaceae bacterium]
MRTCISPEGVFSYGIHKPSYQVRNLRVRTQVEQLGYSRAGANVDNHCNYPNGDIHVSGADWIYEIANPFSFLGTTFIGKSWADSSADNYERIRIPRQQDMSLSRLLASEQLDKSLISRFPRPLLLSLATCSTDPADLIQLAYLCCRFTTTESGTVQGLQYGSDSGNEESLRPEISDNDLFEAVANNPALPDHYKIAMVVRPGAQGGSEIIGDYHDGRDTHIYEYLRKNSYIGGGHYAANMADDAIRYDIDSLNGQDMTGLRYLYYQRTYVRLAAALGIQLQGNSFSEETLEDLRLHLQDAVKRQEVDLTATLWGWNFGFDFSSSGYRLHASHQQVHQQYALIPGSIETYHDGFSPSAGNCKPFSSGDMITECVQAYHSCYGKHFFDDYLQAINTNKRMDGRNDKPSSLVIWEDENVMLFVPKAQTSQWELQLMSKPDRQGRWPGNIIETDTATRRSIDMA